VAVCRCFGLWLFVAVLTHFSEEDVYVCLSDINARSNSGWGYSSKKVFISAKWLIFVAVL